MNTEQSSIYGAWRLSVAPMLAMAQSAGFVGDVGGMVSTFGATVKGAERSTSVLPYVYGDWGPLYARVDTLGVKTLPVGNGHLELAARISTEGYKAGKTAFPAAGDRSSPLPIGVGTFQRTALGGLDQSRWMAGAPSPDGQGRVPNITPARLNGGSDSPHMYTVCQTGVPPPYTA